MTIDQSSLSTTARGDEAEAIAVISANCCAGSIMFLFLRRCVMLAVWVLLLLPFLHIFGPVALISIYSDGIQMR